MKYCSKCGTQLPDQAKFCENCGAPQQSVSDSAAPSNNYEEPKKKTMGQKMKDNFKNNMELQAERRKSLLGKWWFWALLAVALAYFMGACSEKPEVTPQQMDIEEYVKGKIPNPESYEFERMDIEREYPYINAVVAMRKSIEKKSQEPGADLEALRAEDDKLQKAFDTVGYGIACREYTLHFTYQPAKSPQSRLKGIAVARYDADGKLMIITLRPDTLNQNPALQKMKEMGLL